MRERAWTRAIDGLGIAIVASTGWHLLTLHDSAWLDAHHLLTGLLVGCAGLGVLYGGYWHRSRAFESDRSLRVPAWMIAGCVLFSCVGILSLYTGSRRVTGGELLESIHVAGSIGLLAGLVAGTLHVQAIEGIEKAVRAEARADALEAEQERLERLDDLLRHYVLNGVNVIVGHVGELRSATPEEEHHALDAIERSAGTMATLVRHLRGIPDVGGDPSVETVDVESTVESVIAQIRSHSDLSIEAPASVPPARASGTFGEAFYLFLDALRSVTESGGRIEITTRADDDVVLSVIAKPADLPQAIEESLFEPVASDVGLEFYLAWALLDDRNDLTLVEREGDRLAFEFVLDRGSE